MRDVQKFLRTAWATSEEENKKIAARNHFDEAALALNRIRWKLDDISGWMYDSDGAGIFVGLGTFVGGWILVFLGQLTSSKIVLVFGQICILLFPIAAIGLAIASWVLKKKSESIRTRISG
ncbi:MAG: hypothetical protein ABIR80_16230 [Opitutaceae bacterium]